MILVHPSIDPVIFSLGFVDIHWYSMAYISSFLIGLHLIKLFNKNIQSNITSNLIDKFFTWSVVGVILGGRIGYVLFYQFEYFLINPKYLIYIWEGGMSFHGGLIGMIISIILFSKINKINFLALSDLISLVAPIGLFFGRIANFINNELIGRPTEFPLAIIYPTIDNIPRHPSQLYEALLEGLILFIILLIIFFTKNFKNKHGYISGLFLIIYGLFRFTIEFLREPDVHIGLFFDLLTMGQILSIPLILFGLIILLRKKIYA